MTTMTEIEFTEFHEEMVGAIVDRCVKWRRDARELESELAAARATLKELRKQSRDNFEPDATESPTPPPARTKEPPICCGERMHLRPDDFRWQCHLCKTIAPPPADGVGYYCNKCGHKMRVKTPVTCYCDNKDCETDWVKNPSLSAPPPADVGSKIVFDKSAVRWMNQKDSPPAEGDSYADLSHEYEADSMTPKRLKELMKHWETIDGDYASSDSLDLADAFLDLTARVAEVEELNQVERQSNTNAAGRELALQGELDELRLQFEKKLNVIRSRQGTIEIRDKTIADLTARVAEVEVEYDKFANVHRLLCNWMGQQDCPIIPIEETIPSLVANLRKELNSEGNTVVNLNADVEQGKETISRLAEQLATAEQQRDEAIDKRHRAEVALHHALYDENGAVAKATTAQADTARLDWYDKHPGEVFYNHEIRLWVSHDGGHDHLRNAIREGMKREAATATMGTVSKTETGDGEEEVCECGDPMFRKGTFWYCANCERSRDIEQPTPDVGEKVENDDAMYSLGTMTIRAGGKLTDFERIEALMSHYRQSICIERGEYSFYLDPVFHKSLEAAVRSMEAIKTKEGGE